MKAIVLLLWALGLRGPSMALDLHETSAVSAGEAALIGLVLQATCEPQGTPAEVAVAVAYQEGRFAVDRRSSKGALGLMQIIPGGSSWSWSSPLLKASEEARAHITHPVVGAYEGCWRLDYWRGKKGDRYLCHYASGNHCKPAGEAYEEEVLRRVDRYERRMKESYMDTRESLLAFERAMKEKTIRALSVKDPWARALVFGVKSFENRPWKMPKTLGETDGWVLIQASKAGDREAYDADVYPNLSGCHSAASDMLLRRPEDNRREPLWFSEGTLVATARLGTFLTWWRIAMNVPAFEPNGRILGAVRFGRCTEVATYSAGMIDPWLFGPFGWEVEDALFFGTRWKNKGALSLWRPDQEILGQFVGDEECWEDRKTLIFVTRLGGYPVASEPLSTYLGGQA